MNFLPSIYANAGRLCLARPWLGSLLLAVACLCPLASAHAQSSRDDDEDLGTISNSPFSRIGLGDEFMPGGSRQQSLGGGSVASPSNDNLNLNNPALLYYNRVTNLEFISRLGFRSVTDGSEREGYGNWTPTHLSITLPVARPVTVSVGIRQHSAVDYGRRTSSFVNGDTSNLPFSVTNSGHGSLSHVYLATGVRIFRGLTAGVTGTYWLGTLTGRSLSSVTIDSSYNVHADQITRQRFSDIQFKPGLAWRGTIPGTGAMRFGAGLVTDLPTSLSTSTESILSRRLPGSFSTRDTLFADRVAQVQAPVTWQGGIMAEKINKWTLNADLAHTRWDKTRTIILPASQKNTFRASLGFEWLPNYLSNRYLNLVTYRLGLRWQQLPYVVGGDQLNDYSLSLGAGIPILRKEARYTRPVLNAAITAGRRGSVAKAGLSETYVNFTLGIVLNDNLWFVRYKID